MSMLQGALNVEFIYIIIRLFLFLFFSFTICSPNVRVRFSSKHKTDRTMLWFRHLFVLCYAMLSCFSGVQLCETMDCSPSGSSVHGALQARILEWVAMPSSKGSSQPRD